ncbi:L domain-like protein [Neocallimastix lanati (nom. inval.)]|nr:L domain-like protein [Neocallimastix sp. JGI-2020a]
MKNIFWFLNFILIIESIYGNDNIKKNENRNNSEKFNVDRTNGECKFMNKLMNKEESNDCCGDFGIYCLDNHIDEIYVPRNCIENNTLPSSVGSMPYLTVLSLKECELIGEIPKDIGTLQNLKEIDLHYNNITGSIPTSIGNLTKLERLELENNKISGSIPKEIGNLTNLKDLILYNNNLKGKIPTTIGNMQSLKNLYLSDNELRGSIPSEIKNLTNIEVIHISNNKLSGSIPSEIGYLTNLEMIVLDNNTLTGTIPSSIENLTKLERIYLTSNNLDGEIPTKELGKLNKMIRIYLDDNPKLYGRFPKINFNVNNQFKLGIECNITNTNICYDEKDKDSRCTYPTVHYDCSNCQNYNISTVVDDICRCNEGYSGAGYIECYTEIPKTNEDPDEEDPDEEENPNEKENEDQKKPDTENQNNEGNQENSTGTVPDNDLNSGAFKKLYNFINIAFIILTIIILKI